MTNDFKIDDAVTHFLRDCEVRELIKAGERQAGGLTQLRGDLEAIITAKFDEAREILKS